MSSVTISRFKVNLGIINFPPVGTAAETFNFVQFLIKKNYAAEVFIDDG